MQKLLRWLDKHLLQLGVMFLFAFIPLYPKLPLIDIWQTWVYIRWEDFFVAAVILVWLAQLYRKKVTCRSPLLWPILVYWLVGGLSLINAIFIAPRPAHFFPHLALLHYLRRIEYMTLFLVVSASITSLKIVKKYLGVVLITAILVCLYGLGQRYWSLPAFLTMNEEFSKGIPLFLPSTARITSTFAGHYDLAAYLVLIISLGASLIFTLKNWGGKILWLAVTMAGFFLLLLTASRISFMAYLLAVSLVLWLQKKKWLIIPVVLISFYFMKQLGGGTIIRFEKTFRIERVVFDVKSGKPIATLKEFIAEPTATPTPLPAGWPTPTPKPASTGGEDLPLGTGFLALPGKKESLAAAELAKKVAVGGEGEEKLILQLEEMRTATLSSEIATSSALFLLSKDYFVRKAIVYDISFTTRFQGEWPRAWQAFKRNLVLGSGYASVSLATDNDYLRSLAETGLLGFVSFWSLLLAMFLLMRQILRDSQSVWLKGLAIGVLGGLAGLALNAVLIDVFEASKVAFSFWMLSGALVGLSRFYFKPRRPLWQDVWETISSHWLINLLLIVSALITLIPMLNNYFVADDFVWLKWASLDSLDNVRHYFIEAQGFFYRPLAKTIFYYLQPVFMLQPEGYHSVSLLFHLISTLTVYWLGMKLTGKKLVAFLTSFFFVLHPIHEETVFWISSLSTLMAATFYFLTCLVYLCWRRQKGKLKTFFWILAILFFALTLASYEVGVTLPLALILLDWFCQRQESWQKKLVSYAPFMVLTLLYFYIRNLANSHGLSGDYNYRLANLPFNFLGNFFGYFGELTFSYQFVTLYQKARAFWRLHKLIAVSISLIGLFLLRPLWRWLKQDRLLVFGLIWMVVTLLIFLGLGNMTERYAYLASFGYLLVLAYLLNGLKNWLQAKVGLMLAVAGLVLMSVALSWFYLAELSRANQYWQEAGEISRTIQLAVSSSFKEFPEETSLHFANVPVRHGLAWVFPVGLKEALLFIYRDETMKIYQYSSLEEAWKTHEKTTGPTWVFVYQDGVLSKAKR